MSPADVPAELVEKAAVEARLTARDHCDGGCVAPGSGDCPTCKAAECGLTQIATQEPS